MAIEQRVLGDQSLTDELLRTIGGAVGKDESIHGIMVSLEGNAVVATDESLLFVSEERVELELKYEDVAAIEIRAGWWSRGITFSTAEGEVECGASDRDSVVAMGDIVRARAPHVVTPEGEEAGGGLMGRVKGVFDTATGQDIRKFEEFVEASTTVLVGLHRDQATLTERQSELEGEITDMRQVQESIDERLERLEQAIRELREAGDTPNRLETDEPRSDSSPMNRTVLAVGLAAIVLSVASILLRFV